MTDTATLQKAKDKTAIGRRRHTLTGYSPARHTAMQTAPGKRRRRRPPVVYATGKLAKLQPHDEGDG